MLHRPVPVHLAQLLDKPLRGDGLPAIRFLPYRSIPGHFNIAASW
ncbi:hypothetical protein ACNJNY_15525, partial [Citrobacter freundii]